jgi:hypothetical protein
MTTTEETSKTAIARKSMENYGVLDPVNPVTLTQTMIRDISSKTPKNKQDMQLLTLRL